MQSYLERIVSNIRGGMSRMFVAREDESKAEVVASLREVDLLGTLTRRQLFHIASALHKRHYKSNEVIYYEGDPGLGLYIVEDGAVELVQESSHTGSEHEGISANSVFGIASMFGDLRRQETARATVPTTLLGLFSPELKSLIRRNPTAGSALLMVIAEHLAASLVSSSNEYQSAIASLAEQSTDSTISDVAAE